MRLTAVTPSRNSQVPSRRRVISDSTSVPPPVEGWDAISPIAAMPIKRAVRLINWFPQTSWVELRRGFIQHADTGTGLPVESVMAYQGLISRRLFAGSDDTVFDVTTSSVSAGVTGLTNVRIQHINFATTGGNFLYCVNGADSPFYFNGSTWATAAITGVGVDPTEFVTVNAFKNRMFFISNNSTAFHYLDIDSIQGTATRFELGGLMTQGGFLMAMGTWSLDAGDGPEDYAVFVTSRGQVIIYSGTDPDDAATWQLVGRFNMGAPIGRRCLTQVGADIAIICIDGVLPLSKAMIFERAAVVKIALTERIQRVMNESARAYGDHFGWQLISYPKGTRAILNVPVQENEEQQQYVMNTITGAWCLYTGHNGSCWELLDDTPYFGGNEGIVYQADTSGSDNGATISADMMTAFSYYGSPGYNKRWVECQPLITTDGSVTPGITFNTDFREDAPLSVPESTLTTSAKWDNAVWDQAVWPVEATVQTDWRAVTGVGHCASIRLAVEVRQPIIAGDEWSSSLWGSAVWFGDNAAPDVTLQINGFNVAYEKGQAFV